MSTLASIEKIHGTVNTNKVVSGTLTIAPKVTGSISGKIGDHQYPVYDGPYVTTPKFESQELETKDKMMKENVEVEPIYVSKVSNPAGGTTVYIGGIFNA